MISGKTVYPVILCLAFLFVWTGYADDVSPSPGESGEQTLQTANPCEEPQLPLQLKWQQLNHTGGTVVVNLVLQTEQELPSVQLEMVIPAGVRMIRGSDTFQGEVKKGRSHIIPFQFVLDDAGPYRLEAHARALTATGISFRRSTSFFVGSEAETDEKGRSGVLLETPDGLKRIREYPAREVR